MASPLLQHIRGNRETRKPLDAACRFLLLPRAMRSSSSSSGNGTHDWCVMPLRLNTHLAP